MGIERKKKARETDRKWGETHTHTEAGERERQRGRRGEEYENEHRLTLCS